MGLETVALISAGMQVASGFMQYQQQKKADKAADRAYQESIRIAKDQARLDKEDADRAARGELEEAQKHEKLQKMLYLKSGVDISGSPLLVMEETRAKGNENAKNIRDSASSRANLAIRSAKANKPVSRASLVNTALDVGGGLASGYNDYSLLKKQLA
jgi:multidrug efflux pump subunit AcrA (membrane-fusion protein)